MPIPIHPIPHTFILPYFLHHQDCLLKRNELSAVRTQIEREAQEKRKLEDAVMEKMMQQLTMDKSTQYTKKSVDKLRSQKEKLVRTTYMKKPYLVGPDKLH